MITLQPGRSRAALRPILFTCLRAPVPFLAVPSSYLTVRSTATTARSVRSAPKLQHRGCGSVNGYRSTRLRDGRSCDYLFFVSVRDVRTANARSRRRCITSNQRRKIIRTCGFILRICVRCVRLVTRSSHRRARELNDRIDRSKKKISR